MWKNQIYRYNVWIIKDFYAGYLVQVIQIMYVIQMFNSVQNITKLTQTDDELSAKDCRGGSFLASSDELVGDVKRVFTFIASRGRKTICRKLPWSCSPLKWYIRIHNLSLSELLSAPSPPPPSPLFYKTPLRSVINTRRKLNYELCKYNAKYKHTIHFVPSFPPWRPCKGVKWSENYWAGLKT